MDLALAWDPAALRADLAMAGPDLATDAGLRTAVLLSLFTDRLAEADDELPDGSGDRRGWWGDAPVGGAAPDPVGSRLWLLARAKRTEATLRRAEAYARQALAWMVEDGAAGAVEAAAEWRGEARDQLAMRVVVRRAGGDARFDLAWSLEEAR